MQPALVTQVVCELRFGLSVKYFAALDRIADKFADLQVTSYDHEKPEVTLSHPEKEVQVTITPARVGMTSLSDDLDLARGMARKLIEFVTIDLGVTQVERAGFRVLTLVSSPHETSREFFYSKLIARSLLPERFSHAKGSLRIEVARDGVHEAFTFTPVQLTRGSLKIQLKGSAVGETEVKQERYDGLQVDSDVSVLNAPAEAAIAIIDSSSEESRSNVIEWVAARLEGGK